MSSEAKTAILKLENVRLQFGQRHVLEQINLSVAKREWIVILGVNGSGKSSLLRASLGLLPIQSGKIELNGKSIGLLSRKEMSRLTTFLPQRAQIHVPYAVEDFLSMSHYASSSQMTLTECSELFDIKELLIRKMNELSGGEFQRVLLAGAFFQGTELVALDEPTTHLDLKAQVEITELLLKLRVARKVSCIVVTHDLNLAKKIADRIIIMNDGRLSAEFSEYGADFTEAISTSFAISKEAICGI